MDGARLHELFEAQVGRTPDAVALQQEGRKLSYRDLDQRANQLAHLLLAEGVGRGAAVGICLGHSFEMVLALLATLKAGGVYVPLDTSCPAGRIGYLIENSSARWVLSRSDLRDLLAASIRPVLLDLEADRISSMSTKRPPEEGSGEDLIYIIHTSGSSGRPKGVQLRHRNVVNYVTWAADFYVAGEILDFPLFTPLSFDLTVTSLFVPLVSGGRIVIYADDPAAPGTTLWRVLAENAVDVVKLTPSHLALMQYEDLTGSRIRKLIVGGEQLRTDLASAVWERFGGAVEIYNEYGPTETTVGSTVHRYDPRRDQSAAVPIGRPIAGTRVYVVDGNDNECGLGEEGELYIGGEGVAAGYINDAEETAARFRSDPLGGEGAIYATGDIGRQTADGVLEFRGRRDEQIKLHGFRIEPAEIETVLNADPAVSQSIVVLRDDVDGGPMLVAYIVADGAASAQALQAVVAEQVPPYMVPAAIVVLDSLPLTPNGKIDRAALPDPE